MPDPNSGFSVPPELAQQIREINEAPTDYELARDIRVYRALLDQAKGHQTLQELKPELIRNHAVVEVPDCLAGPNPQTCPFCGFYVALHGALDGTKVCMPSELYEALVAL